MFLVNSQESFSKTQFSLLEEGQYENDTSTHEVSLLVKKHVPEQPVWPHTELWLRQNTVEHRLAVENIKLF